MLSFEPFSIERLKRALPIIKNNPSLCSDISAGFIFMWHKGADVRFCVWNNTLVVSHIIEDQISFSYPIGENVDLMIDKLIEYVLENHYPLRFFSADEIILDKIRGDKRLQPAMWAYDRRWSDYIYSFSEALTFSGKKFSGQRNHINKFKRLYGEPDIRVLTPNDRGKIKTLLTEYEKEHTGAKRVEKMEIERTKQLLDVYAELDLIAVGLFIDGKLAAFSIGEIVGDSLIIHIEKALTKFNGIYPTIYSGFVNLVNNQLGHSLTYINREDDSGDMGLRTSKSQYHPITFANKHLVHIGSPAVKMDDSFSIPAGNLFLTEIKESDKPEYLKLNTDIENNKFWGYDYREDPWIPLPPDENTFYDSYIHDKSAGDSINFAIRLSENGKMIGEAILWNFTYDGTAELGCRIFPEYHQKGYGKTAFKAVAEFAVQYLDVKVWARCHRENEVSYRMITGSGFSKKSEDETFYYFE